MQITSPPRWLMIVSTASAVLPVERSPMMSSRCPRPIGVMESIALIPVWSGSFTSLVAGCELSAQALEPTADAPVREERADLEDDPADEIRIDRPGRVDLPARGLLDRRHDRRRLLVGQVVGGRQLDGESVL